MKTKLLFNGTEFLGQQNIPFMFPDKTLLAPGEWNNNKYTSKEIKKAFENTDWTDKSNFSLYLDHQDTKEQGVGNWVGFVKNIKLLDGNLVGDLEVWNPSLVIYLNEAEAKFGVSATLKGTENEDNTKMEDFHFESFSVVTNPACKESYINLSEDLKPNERRLKIITMAEDEAQGAASVEGSESKTEEKPEDKTSEEKKPEEKPTEETKENADDEEDKKDDKEDEDELSEKDLLEITTLSEWTDFVKSFREKTPGASLKEIAKAFKSRNTEMSELKEMSDAELVKKISLLSELLNTRHKKLEDDEKETTDDKIEKLSSKLSLLSSKLNEPERKTLSASKPKNDGIVTSDPLAGMADFLSEGGQGMFGIE